MRSTTSVIDSWTRARGTGVVGPRRRIWKRTCSKSGSKGVVDPAVGASDGAPTLELVEEPAGIGSGALADIVRRIENEIGKGS